MLGVEGDEDDLAEVIMSLMFWIINYNKPQLSFFISDLKLNSI